MSKPIDPKVYCRLGHYNLLLGLYPKGKFFCVSKVRKMKAKFEFCSLIRLSALSHFGTQLLESMESLSFQSFYFFL